MNPVNFILSRTGLPKKSVENTLQLLKEDATIPFISRYRKEMTGNLDEVQVAQIVQFHTEYEELEKRKKAILKSIAEQEALNEQLESKIFAAGNMVELEDLYLPYKKKRKTRADSARELGLEPLAKILMAQNSGDAEAAARKFVTKDVVDVAAALQGAKDIIAEWINEHQGVRNRLRRQFEKKAMITSKVVKKKAEEEDAQKFRNYFEWEEKLNYIPSHRLLAILRAEKEGFVRVKVEVEHEESYRIVSGFILKSQRNSCTPHIEEAIDDALKRLLFPALSNEALSAAKEKADAEAIKVFADNLRQLLLAPPLGSKRILALDPGFKSGCKLVCLDEKGDLQHNETIFPHAPQRETALASKKVKSLVNAYNIEAIAIGNGTASRETEFFIKKILFDRDVQVFVVNEAGASVYSASKIARAEFPNFDVTVRGAVSIGRRLADPLAELVKIDPKSIGVGQYQHDVDQAKLKSELDRVVESCVNAIGVNLNSASAPLLSYVSGIGPSLADNIINYRRENGEFSSRKDLLKVPRLGARAFEQAAGFLKVPGSKNPLDNSTVHPESYSIVEKMAADLGLELEELIGNKKLISEITPENYIFDSVGLPTIKDILRELEKPGVDPRKSAKVFEFDPNVKSISDLKPGLKLPGIVNNITNFGCFVDIGIKESGLVHISKLKNEFVSDVNSVVKLHQHVQVTVMEVDEARKRIQLSMID
ncbi:RNA-binding transcriptional accessory protein [Salinimicrobium tongyeongense]|uniref:RNA-binding transcriptional accessory protein n=1 Tax=Salinimicrobium tongyeongense TaxID=2809707 RepID=A0ABY6NSP7_9FLAO|nr:Tex family protein [Salinimicrobium tongyeongense]UZH55932.1 RNA-binding transcriptional accessory protein [Salinimicrobium tongyeongense]